MGFITKSPNLNNYPVCQSQIPILTFQFSSNFMQATTLNVFHIKPFDAGVAEAEDGAFKLSLLIW